MVKLIEGMKSRLVIEIYDPDSDSDDSVCRAILNEDAIKIIGKKSLKEIQSMVCEDCEISQTCDTIER